MISIDGNNNIVIKHIYGSSVTINYNDSEQIKIEIEKFKSEFIDENNIRIREEIQVAIDVLSKVYNREIFPDRLTIIPNLGKEDVIGRDAEIMIVEELLETNKKVVLVSGVGGIGKTALAKAYINENIEKYKHTAWVEVTELVKEAFVFNRQIVDSLGLHEILEKLDKKDNYVENAFELVINRMRQLKGKNLLVIDNANDDIEDLDVLDRISLKPYWHVLVTSRSKLEGFEEYHLDVLKPDFAQKLFYRHYQYERNDALVQEILNTINYHTLTIEVLAKTAETRFFKLTELIEILKKKLQIFPVLPKV